MKTLLSLFAGLGLLTLSSVCFAQAPKATADSATTTDGYSYTFLDELLNAKGLDSTAPLLHIRPVGLHDRLLRPRTQFVSEMLKSVEVL